MIDGCVRGYVGSAGHKSQLWNMSLKCGKWFYDVLQDACFMVGPVRSLFVGILYGWFYDVPRDAHSMVGPVRSLFVGHLCGYLGSSLDG